VEYLNSVQRKKAVVFFVSDFLSKPFEPAFRVAAKRYDMIAVTMSDPREHEFPDVGLIELKDPETGRTFLVDSSSKSFRDKYLQGAQKRRYQLKTLFNSMGVDQINISTAQDYVEPLVRFFKKREKMRA